MSHLRVTVVEVGDDGIESAPETATVGVGDFILIPYAPCYLDSAQHYGRKGTTVLTVKNHRMRREPDPSTRNTRAERLPDPISGNLLDEDPSDAIERAIENAASPAPKAAPAAPHEPGSAQPAPDPAGLREAAQAALDEWDAATKDWMEWWARGGKGFHQFPVAAANHLRAALASEADLMHLAASPAPKAAPADPTAKPPFIYCPHCGGSWSEMAVVRAAIKKAAPAGLDVERRTPLASPDSLRLDPEDSESVERLRALSEAATPGPWASDGWHVHAGSGMSKRDVAQLPGNEPDERPDAALIVAAVNYVRSRLAHEWKASALPDPAPEAQA